MHYFVVKLIFWAKVCSFYAKHLPFSFTVVMFLSCWASRFVDDFMLMQVVASQDWPEVTKYAGLVSAQTRRQELIQDLFKVWQDPQRGTVNGGMVRYDLVHL